ncbi:MAG: hypothetical protein R3A80_07095 [Bdellovibrionota bacterium]
MQRLPDWAAFSKVKSVIENADGQQHDQVSINNAVLVKPFQSRRKIYKT